MFELVALFVLTTFAFASPHDLPEVSLLDGKIVGGDVVKITDYPHQVSLLHNNQHDCGGSIIGKKHILTAAHCTDGSQPASMSIRVGSDDSEAGGKIVQVAKVHQHPKYNGGTVDYDICVLELAEELTLGPTVGIIKLPNANQHVKVNTKVTITGWGSVKEGGSASKKLQAVTVPVISVADCKKAYGAKRITKRMFCAGIRNVGGKDACQGDSGGPLIAKNIQYGIVSWGKGCAEKKYPGVYTNIASLRSFINAVSGI